MRFGPICLLITLLTACQSKPAIMAESPSPTSSPDSRSPLDSSSRPATQPLTQPQTSPVISESQPSSRVLHPFHGITVHLDDAIVEIEAVVCLDGGWLEQVACGVNSREHESLVVITAKPSDIHTALLLAGFESGKPGRWVYEEERYYTVPPEGSALDVFVRYLSEAGEQVEQPIGAWIVDHRGNHDFPNLPWIFGGSGFAPRPEWMGEAGEYYIADQTGSIIGLVTFGDELLGFSQVISDQDAISPPEWVINEDAIPEVGTEVILVLRAAKEK